MVAAFLGALGIEIHRGLGKTGVVGTLRGTRQGARRIGLRADMDALFIREATGRPYASSVEGKMHACGHDGHTTMLLGAAEKLAAKVRKGQFDMDDLLSQLRQLRKMGGMQGLLGMLPGALQAKAAMSKAKIDEKQLKRQEAVILSMTPKERRNPDLIHASRKKRIAAGSGVAVQDVNKLLKQHADMLKMMKRVNKLGEKGFMRSLGGMTPPPGFPR